MKHKETIAVIGLGYVGLPLAVEFAKQYNVIGFDIKSSRIKELQNAIDNTLEVESNTLKKVLLDGVEGKKGLSVTDDPKDIYKANIYIVTVPTPTDDLNKPILTPLIKASEAVGKVLKPNDIVIYESTVYPGVTEDICVPVLEQYSGLVFNTDFFVGYSPERINPGDK
ncbi:MAG: nucleotide sugar dehydrogenase, partial [Bacteroidetes bacterium]|nr:nucleotide sugar dehydrogenase [Bacteroidota bacterium]